MFARNLCPAVLVAVMVIAASACAILAKAGNSAPVVIEGGIRIGPASSNASAGAAPAVPDANVSVEANETADLAAEARAREQAEQGACALGLATVALLAWVPFVGAATGWVPGRARAA
jgi:hypothetical protein